MKYGFVHIYFRNCDREQTIRVKEDFTIDRFHEIALLIGQPQTWVYEQSAVQMFDVNFMEFITD